MLLTVCAGAALYSVGEIVITVSRHPLPWLVHPVAVRVSDVGLQRVYAFMSEAAVLLFALSLGAALLAPDRRIRRGDHYSQQSALPRSSFNRLERSISVSPSR